MVPPACGWVSGLAACDTGGMLFSPPLQIARVQSLQRVGLIELDAKSVKEVLVGKSRPYSVFIIAGAGGRVKDEGCMCSDRWSGWGYIIQNTRARLVWPLVHILLLAPQLLRPFSWATSYPPVQLLQRHAVSLMNTAAASLPQTPRICAAPAS